MSSGGPPEGAEDEETKVSEASKELQEADPLALGLPCLGSSGEEKTEETHTAEDSSKERTERLFSTLEHRGTESNISEDGN